MKYSICIIDDDIPAGQANFEGKIDDTKILYSSDLRILLEEGNWDNDYYVKQLIENLLADKDKWDITAFTFPEFYINHVDSSLFRAQIIILDYDFPGLTSGYDFDEYLKQILEVSFSIIYVYSHVEGISATINELKQEKFEAYSERIYSLSKKETKSVNKLLKDIENLNEKNFSFKFGTELRKKSLQALDSVLVDLGRLTFNQIGNFITFNNSNKRELLDFIGEKIKNELSFSNIKAPDPDKSRLNKSHEELAKKLWSYRLYFYHKGDDDLVRKGDIVKLGKDIDTLFLVITGDCDLVQFWKKNFSFINLLPIHRLNNDSKVNLKIKFAASNVKTTTKVGSMIGGSKLQKDVSEGPFILPFINIDAEYFNYIGLPTKICSIHIKLPDEIIKQNGDKKIQLTYSKWNKGKKKRYKKICTLSEPFLTPVIAHILHEISGLGVPDYPEFVGKLIPKDLENILA